MTKTVDKTRQLLSAGEIARRLNRTRRAVVMAIARLNIEPEVILDGNRKAYAPEVVVTIGDNMRATGGSEG
jgi:hypothetical protein